MTDWAIALGGGPAPAAEHLAPVLRHLGCDPPPSEQGTTEAAVEATFLIGSRLGRRGRRLLASDGSATLLFDGRLDNRNELARSLDLERRGIDDPALVLAAWRRGGEGVFAALEGPFVVVIWDEPRRRLVLARDVLGDQSASYHRPRDSHAPFLVGPDAEALLAAPGVSGRANERSLARLLALQGPAPGETYFADVEEVPPGHVVTWTRETGLTRRRFATLDADPSARRERDPVSRF